MSQQDVETMRSAYAAFNRGDIAAVLNVFDPNIEWHEPGGGRAPRGTFHGGQTVAQDVFSTIPENFDEFRADPEQFIDAGDHVVVVGHFHGRAKSGQELNVPYVHVWPMRNGKPVRFHNYVEAEPWATAWGG